MMVNTQAKQFDWTDELHQVVIKSLTTTFGLDFLLFEDKKGGDVDTIHNAREWQKSIKETGGSDIELSSSFQAGYQNRGEYNSHDYHSHKSYRQQGQNDKAKQHAGELHDNYRNQIMGGNENRQLDHTIAASEIHNDAGRVLSGLSGVDLSNQDTNLNSTHWYVNNLKRDHSVDHFVNNIAPKKVEQLKADIVKTEAVIQRMPTNTAQQRDAKRQQESKLHKDKEKTEALESVLDNKEEILKADKIARDNYNRQINVEYYTSSKFLKNTALASVNTGLKMGIRQVLGFVLAEVWFELKEQVPQILKKQIGHFQLNLFLQHIRETLQNIWTRVTEKFHDLLVCFKDSVLSGVLASITTTILNIFLTTEKMVVKLIREMWNNLVQAAKLVFFNPGKLSLGDLWREVARLLGMGVSISIGVVLNQHLASVMLIPFGTEIAALLSALVSGLLTVGVTYFLDHSEVMKKVWTFLNKFKDKATLVLEHYQEVNRELDRYLNELAKIEFNLNLEELKIFADSLEITNCELERSIVLDAEIARRKIELPFESGNESSVRNWLANL